MNYLMFQDDSIGGRSLGQTLDLVQIIHAETTHVQQVVIAESARFGRILTLDGVIQSAQADEHLYHEALVQPAMLMHPNPKDVLIIGGGEGATLREVLKYACVTSATMVDIDSQLVEIARHHLQDWHQGSFDDPRVRLVFDDGRHFVHNDQSQYDIAIIDVVDLIEGGPAQSLYTQQFYRTLQRRLRPGAIIIVQALEFSFLQHAEHATLLRTLRSVFGFVTNYRIMIPSFQGDWGFIIASNTCDVGAMDADVLDREIATRLPAGALRHLDGRYLCSATTMCTMTRGILQRTGRIFDDADLEKATGESSAHRPIMRIT